jgi:hypothetical protein
LEIKLPSSAQLNYRYEGHAMFDLELLHTLVSGAERLGPTHHGLIEFLREEISLPHTGASH